MKYQFQIVPVRANGVSDRYYEGNLWKTVLESNNPVTLLYDIETFLNDWDDDFPLEEFDGEGCHPSKITDYWFRVVNEDEK